MVVRIKTFMCTTPVTKNTGAKFLPSPLKVFLNNEEIYARMTYTLFASDGQELVILIRLGSKDFDAPSLLKRS